MPRSAEDTADIQRMNHRALFLTFTGQADAETARVAWEAVAYACRMNEERPMGGGVDGIMNLVEREGRRNVYLSLSNAIEMGKRNDGRPAPDSTITGTATT